MDIEQIDPIQADLLKQSWFKNWHLYAAWLYLIIILFDFLLAPMANVIILAYFHYAIVQWTPLTLQSGGIFHIAMMAIIGISSWGRSQQMIEGIRNMPDYSPYGSYNPITNSPIQPLNPPVDPATVLQASKRGIPKGT